MDTKELRLTALKNILGKLKSAKSSKPTITITEEKKSVGGSPIDKMGKDMLSDDMEADNETEGSGSDMASLLKSLKDEMGGGGSEEKDEKESDWKKLLKEHSME